MSRARDGVVPRGERGREGTRIPGRMRPPANPNAPTPPAGHHQSASTSPSDAFGWPLPRSRLH